MDLAPWSTSAAALTPPHEPRFHLYVDSSLRSVVVCDYGRDHFVSDTVVGIFGRLPNGNEERAVCWRLGSLAFYREIERQAEAEWERMIALATRGDQQAKRMAQTIEERFGRISAWWIESGGRGWIEVRSDEA